MTSLLLHSGKTEQYRALGETGQPVYYSALQLRKAIARRLKGRERHLAIPQRDQQGEGVDWYSGIEGDVVPWRSATEGEREDARIQLAAFQKEIQAVEIPDESQGGDHEVFARLLKWVCHFPDENFVYLVDGTPVLTFWGFTHPEIDRHANPLQCLYPQAEPELASATPPITPVPASLGAAAPVAKPVVAEEPTRPWWRRLWWLLPLALLLLLLLLFGFRACSTSTTAPGTGINLPSGDATAFSSAKPEWQGWDVWPFKGQTSGIAVPRGSVELNGGFGLPTIGSGAGALDWALPDTDIGLTNAATETGLPDADTSLAPTETPLPNGEPPVTPELSPGELPAAPAELSGDSPEAITPPELGTMPEPLSLPANPPDGAAAFLNGDWRGAGVMDSQSGRPLQVRYAFDEGEGQMQIRRGGPDGMNCTGPVAATMQDGELHVEAKERARCEDGSNYEMPRVECRQAEGEIADCAASYDDESFPMQLQNASE
ncbi:SrfA family protein [Vreelandella neptunia]|uniref:SrfA family protein n=1 Tax=Vreelandella neptunia TaxID=115551 RepID=A0ABS9S956_9GAMM|nr:SrfA family protein [Halomonas neptunia]MCH4812635.1 SrfA family protein [Halomonas neptunia]